MDDKLKEYLLQKYGQDLGNINTAQAFSNIGDVISGQKVGSSSPFYTEQRKLAEQTSLGELARQQDYDLKKQALEEKKANEDFNRIMKQMTLQQQGQLAREGLDVKKMMAQNLGEQKATREKERTDKESEKNLQALSKSLTGTQDSLNAIDNIETTLGGPLESFSKKDGNLMKNGKPVDLPGVSIPLVGRTSFYSDEARDLASKAATVFNSVLKDRSGQAVTNNEMERLKNEFGQGKFNTEAELVEALKNYKLSLSKEMKNREAGFKPEMVQEYKSRGGRTSYDLPNAPQIPKTPQTQKIPVKKLINKKTGETKVIYSDGSEEVQGG